MGIKLQELEEGTPITLQISSKEKSMSLNAVIRKHVKNNIAFISLQGEEQRKLIFDNVQVDMESGRSYSYHMAQR